MQRDFKYDVFLSHSTKDKNVVRELANKLKKDGVAVWFDEWEIKAGDIIGLKIEEGLEQSRTLVLAMSKNSFSSDWVSLERHTVIFRDPTNAERRFVPLRIDDSEIRDILKQFAYIDWRKRKPGEYKKLLTICYKQKEIESESFKIARTNIERINIKKADNDDIIRSILSEDEKLIISGSRNGIIQVWELKTRKCIKKLFAHGGAVWGLVVVDDQNFISGAGDGSVKMWSLVSGKCVSIFERGADPVECIAISSDKKLLSVIHVNGIIRVWDINENLLINQFRAKQLTYTIIFCKDNKHLITGSSDGEIELWNIESGKVIRTRIGHKGPLYDLVLFEEGRRLASVGEDAKISIWDLETWNCLSIFEGHTSAIFSISLCNGKKCLVTGAMDKSIRVWDYQSGISSVITRDIGQVYTVVVNGQGSMIISSLENGELILWELPISIKSDKGQDPIAHYTNAKVLLVGDSGVGKSGLAIRLTENRFLATTSTDGVWATQLKLPVLKEDNEAEREIWIWDFAGQSDYRLIHQLFMDETSLAVLVFNPQTDNPFEGLSQWTYDLQRAARKKFKKLLVAGRCDRGGVTVSKQSIDEFHLIHGFDGGQYFVTSANTGEGCSELSQAIVNTIDWADIPWTASPYIFQLLKNEVVKLKEEGKVLLRLSELKQQLEIRLQNQIFSIDELNAVVGLLAGPGLVWKLEFGNFVLLEPERINSYAAAVIRRVRQHTEEIGVISEEDVLKGELDYQDMKRLPIEEEQIVLRAMHQTFVDHGLCLRELTEAGTLLVFPSYFKRERPELESHPEVLITYKFKGNLDEIYSTLIVKLHHTTVFKKDQLWKFAADFKTQTDQLIGLKLAKLKEGNGEIAIYLEPKISDDTKVTFIKYVHEHLKAKASEIVRIRHYVCSKCNTPVVDHKTVLRKIESGKSNILCLECEKRIMLRDVIEDKFASEQMLAQVSELEEKAKSSIDNESKELILLGHAFAIAGEAGQIFRPIPNSDWGIDGEIEFKNEKGQASGKRLYLQLKSGDSYLYTRKKDGKEIFKIKNPRHSEYWTSHAYPVMLVIRTSNNEIRWMNITEYLAKANIKSEVVFEGEPFTVLNVVKLKEKILFSESES